MKRSVSFSIDEKFLPLIRDRAKKDRRTMSWIVEEAIRIFLKPKKEVKPVKDKTAKMVRRPKK